MFLHVFESIKAMCVFVNVLINNFKFYNFILLANLKYKITFLIDSLIYYIWTTLFSPSSLPNLSPPSPFIPALFLFSQEKGRPPGISRHIKLQWD